MKTNVASHTTILIAIMLFVACSVSYAISYNVSFTASGVTNTVGSVQVDNLTRGTSVTVPDGDTLSLIDQPTAVDEHTSNNSGLWFTQNASTGKSILNFVSSQAGSTHVAAYSFDGRKVAELITLLEAGNNSLELSLPTGNYAIRVSGTDYSYSAKLVSPGSTDSKAGIKFLSNHPENSSAVKRNKAKSATTSLIFHPGDQLLYTATSGEYIASVPDMTAASTNIHFVFYDIPTSSIPSGTFMMGSPTTESGRSSIEIQHQVTLSAFRMSKYEITNEQYANFLNAKGIGSNRKYAAGAYPDEPLIYASSDNYDFGLHFNGSQWVSVVGYESSPVINVTWFGAVEFATYSGGTLPTEAQWEYACRAGTITPFNTGTCLTNSDANYWWFTPYTNCSNTVSSTLSKTQPSGTYNDNAFGLYDMHGNVSEWCADWFANYQTIAQTNPKGANTGNYRIIRDGNYTFSASRCRSANRNWGNPRDYTYSIGFRVAFPSSLSVDTQTPDNITDKNVQLHGNVTGKVEEIVTERGFCYATTSNPTLANNIITVGAGVGAFSATISSLSSNTTYYVRAYAISSWGTSYGEEKTFTTLSINQLLNIQTVVIPAGTFTMGSPLTEPKRDYGEVQHQVTLSAFRMSKYEITNSQFAVFLNAKGIGSNGISTGGEYVTKVLISASSGNQNWGLNYLNNQWVPVVGYENHPAIHVTWYGATEFAAYAGGSLPTDAQWEYACRAGTTTIFSTGNCLTNLQANYNWAYAYSTCTNTVTTSPGKTQAVGTYQANAFGLYQMHGNVWEWCSDWFDAYPTTPQTDPTGAATGTYRVLRGGGFFNNGAGFCRSAIRSFNEPVNSNYGIGFRIVYPAEL